MPSPDPITPADLRPGQRVRITRRYHVAQSVQTWEGRVTSTEPASVWLSGIGKVSLIAKDLFTVTQTIEVIE